MKSGGKQNSTLMKRIFVILERSVCASPPTESTKTFFHRNGAVMQWKQNHSFISEWVPKLHHLIHINTHSSEPLRLTLHKPVRSVQANQTKSPKWKVTSLIHLHHLLCTCTKMVPTVSLLLQFKVITCVIFLSCFHLSLSIIENHCL